MASGVKRKVREFGEEDPGYDKSIWKFSEGVVPSKKPSKHSQLRSTRKRNHTKSLARYGITITPVTDNEERNMAFLPFFQGRKELEESIIGDILPCCSRTGANACIGKGGFGKVYREEGPEINGVNEYALKIINSTNDCVKREIDTLNEFTGKGIFPNYYAAFKERSLFGYEKIGIFMELLLDPWQSLQKLIYNEEDGIFTKSVECQELFFRSLGPIILALVERLHSYGKVHHDIKPDNIRVKLGDDNCTVIDARFVDAGSTGPVLGPFSENEYPGTKYYSLESAVRGFEYGSVWDRKTALPDPSAMDLLWRLKRSYGSTIAPARNEFSLTQIYKALKGIEKDPSVDTALDAGWPARKRSPVFIDTSRGDAPSIKRKPAIIEGGKRRSNQTKKRKHKKHKQQTLYTI